MVTDLPPTAEEIAAKEAELNAQIEKEAASDEPTPEELEAQKAKEEQEARDAEEAEAARKKAEDIANGKTDEEEDGEEEETGPDDEAKDEKEEEKQPQKAGPEETPEQKIARLEKERKASFVENQVIAQSKKKYEEQIAQAQAMPEPTEDQVRAEVEALGENYDSMSLFYKRMAKNDLHNRLKNEAIAKIQEEQKQTQDKIEARRKEVDVFSIHPDTLKKFPRLEGKQADFNVFASKPTRLQLDLEDLATLYLANLPAAEKHKGQMFETGNGGKAPEKKKNGGKLSIAESAALMQTNYAKYQEYLMAGKISEDVDQG